MEKDDLLTLTNILGQEDKKVKNFLGRQKKFPKFKGFNVSKVKSGEMFTCVYCGKQVHELNGVLVSEFGTVCWGSENKTHKMFHMEGRCVHCGEKTKVVGKEVITSRGTQCKNSPTKKHTFS